jgi:hypothetical protein
MPKITGVPCRAQKYQVFKADERLSILQQPQSFLDRFNRTQVDAINIINYPLICIRTRD